ncbi:hypothetical protein HDU96_003667 [Phlyctochytrium bullatum]|nr:hypothetical protein HDU96_003667 [Phlyctochytrium bullatum]
MLPDDPPAVVQKPKVAAAAEGRSPALGGLSSFGKFNDTEDIRDIDGSDDAEALDLGGLKLNIPSAGVKPKKAGGILIQEVTEDDVKQMKEQKQKKPERRVTFVDDTPAVTKLEVNEPWKDEDVDDSPEESSSRSSLITELTSSTTKQRFPPVRNAAQFPPPAPEEEDKKVTSETEAPTSSDPPVAKSKPVSVPVVAAAADLISVVTTEVESTPSPAVSVPRSSKEQDGKFTFTYMDNHKYAGFDNKEVQALLFKWGMQDHCYMKRFSYDRILQGLQIDGFLKDFFNDPVVNGQLKVLGTMDRWGSLGPVSGVHYTPTHHTVTSLSFFDRLKSTSWDSPSPLAPVRPDGQIKKCLDEYFEGFVVSDELRRCLLMEEFESFDLFSAAERKEVIFLVFKALCLGGRLCQFEDELEPYLDTTKKLYKDLVTDMLDGLPAEILDGILATLNPPDLLSLSTTSRRSASTVLPALYSRVVLHTERQSLRFLFTVTWADEAPAATTTAALDDLAGEEEDDSVTYGTADSRLDDNLEGSDDDDEQPTRYSGTHGSRGSLTGSTSTSINPNQPASLNHLPRPSWVRSLHLITAATSYAAVMRITQLFSPTLQTLELTSSIAFPGRTSSSVINLSPFRSLTAIAVRNPFVAPPALLSNLSALRLSLNDWDHEMILHTLRACGALTSLGISFFFTSNHEEPLLAAVPHLGARLHTLDLEWMGVREVDHLVRTMQLPHLTTLNLSMSIKSPTEPLFAHLASPHLRKVVLKDMTNADPNAAGLTVLAHRSPNLTHLSLENMHFDPPVSLVPIVSHCPHLRHLGVCRRSFNDLPQALGLARNLKTLVLLERRSEHASTPPVFGGAHPTFPVDTPHPSFHPDDVDDDPDFDHPFHPSTHDLLLAHPQPPRPARRAPTLRDVLLAVATAGLMLDELRIISDDDGGLPQCLFTDRETDALVRADPLCAVLEGLLVADEWALRTRLMNGAGTDAVPHPAFGIAVSDPFDKHLMGGGDAGAGRQAWDNNWRQAHTAAPAREPAVVNGTGEMLGIKRRRMVTVMCVDCWSAFDDAPREPAVVFSDTILVRAV